jgi:DNA-binding PadR family transcriptional regulator
MQETGLASGTLYPVLMRLVDYGWLETRWEHAPATGRRARHLYRIAPGMGGEARGLLRGWTEDGLVRRELLPEGT